MKARYSDANPKPKGERDIAVIGMSCRFPGARNYQTFWENLNEKRFSVSEIPQDRWDWRSLAGGQSDPETALKWGGFIKDVDAFDPLFFNISPKEADYMDPQHRLFLQAAWHAIEDAGYAPSHLAGSNIGVYAGVSKNDYAELMREGHEAIISFLSTGTVHSILANRVSYLLDLHGKSEVVDTACSSFMVALNNAVRDIRSGQCEAAIVGGVNAILTPTMYLSHSKSGMLSKSGKCRTFDAKADGYVRAEGVGVVFVKSLAQALRDDDQILGIIKGCAVQHGGRANSLTSPNVSSQAAVIKAALADAAVDPGSVSFIETHGTGTPLGDPIEINALKLAYGSDNGEATPHCGLGTVKTNTGHLESAAGVAGLIKVLLSFQNRRLPALLHFEKLNPYIELEGSPFYIADKAREWQAPHGQPLRAGLSSFGMGGVNAHMILEAPPERLPRSTQESRRSIILVSAKKGRLKAQAQQLCDFLQVQPDLAVADVAYTLMFGRDHHEERLAFVASSIAEICTKLGSYTEGAAGGYSLGFLKKRKHQEPPLGNATQNLETLAQQWAQGDMLGWDQTSFSGRKIALPGYAFRNRRCWFKESRNEIERKPVVQQASVESPIREIFAADAEAVAGHRVGGQKMLPAAGYLVWLWQKIKETQPSSAVCRLNDVFWQAPVTFDREPKEITLEFEGQGDVRQFQIHSESTINCRGTLHAHETAELGEQLDIAAILQRCDAQIEQSELYALFGANGLGYGSGFQVIQRVHWHGDEAVSVIDPSHGLDEGILDGLFQTVVALGLKNGSVGAQQQIPFFLERFISAFNLAELRYVYVEQQNTTSSKALRYNITACDKDGRVIARLENFSKRVLKSKPLLYYTSEWLPQPVEKDTNAIHGLLLVGDEQDLALDHNGLLLRLQFGETYEACSENHIIINKHRAEDFLKAFTTFKSEKILFSHILIPSQQPSAKDLGVLLLLTQSLIKAKIRNPLKIVYHAGNVSLQDRPIIFAAGGLARTLKFENGNIHLEIVGMEGPLPQNAEALNNILCAVPAPLHEVMLEGSQRHIRRMKRLAKGAPQNKVALKHGGIYLISGGAGGLGRIFCTHLAQKYAAKLILLGRRQIDASIEALLAEITDLGGQASYFSTDVSRADQVNAALEEARNTYGAIHGVIHASGIIDDSFILRKTLPTFETILKPKINGTHNVDQATARDQLDFFLMFSSVASLMPNQGQSGYATGNAFMDSFATYRNQLVSEGERSGRSLAINWPLWANGGMQVSQEEQRHLLDEFGMKPLPTHKGIEMLYAALEMAENNGLDHLAGLVGDGAKIDKSFRIGPEINWRIEDITAFLERHLLTLVAQILKTEDIALSDTFDELGLDSLGYLKITQAINQTFQTSVKPTLFFEAGSLEQFTAKLLESHQDTIKSYLMKLGSMAIHYASTGLLNVGQSDGESGVYQRTYTNREFYMVDHVVEGKYNVPGACYIEMARQAATLDQPDRVVWSLRKNYWAKQLSSDGPPFTAHIRLTHRDAATAYEIYSLNGKQKTVHASGEIGYEPHEQQQCDLASIRQRCGTTRSRDQIYQQIHAEGLHVGPSFMPIDDLVLSEDEALAEMSLPEAINNTWQDYLLHPSLLTGVFQTALINNRFGGDDEREFIPIAIENVAINGPIPKRCYVYSQVRPQTKNSPHLKKFHVNVCDENGRVVVALEDFAIKAKNVEIRERMPARMQQADPNALMSKVQALLIEKMAPVIGIEPHEIDAEDAFEHYGINSIMITDLNIMIEEAFGRGHSKTLFFENVNVTELAEYFLEEHRESILEMLPSDVVQGEVDETPEPQQEPLTDVTPQAVHRTASHDIAIIGMSGRYPKANTLDELWQNLKQGRDCVEEIPQNRFDIAPFYDPERKNGGLYAKWGSFIDDVDKFDPLFFNISPREAEQMDPQERLLLQTAWETLEDAGYSRKELARTAAKTGVFVGALWQPYTALGVEATMTGNAMGPSGLLYNTANRISYFFNFQGPSMAVDTACSASLTALHLACHSIRRNECQTALAGGVNLSLDVSKYLFLSNNNFLSSEGKCRSFGEGGDGYVPGEGVGLVLLKPLEQAVADGDHIYGVIKGTAINHGGKTNGYTVPKPQAQADVIAEAWRESGIDPRTIGYIEAHGTGTALGDPIEITGLSKAFATHTRDKQFCAIGSIKSNIGHLEANAAMAGLTKILLQFKHGTLVPSIHSASTNPNIDFSRTPFYVQRETSAWHSETKRRSALSSFGAGGSNAHLIVEEYIAAAQPALPDEPMLVPLSAKTDERLLRVAENLLAHLQRTPATPGYLRNLAFTLQVGREAMASRVAFVVQDLDDLTRQLTGFTEGRLEQQTYLANNEPVSFKKMGMLQDRDFQATIGSWLRKKNYKLVAELWAQGADMDWHELYQTERPKRVPLPVYPFLKESYWLPRAQPIKQAPPQIEQHDTGELTFQVPVWQAQPLNRNGKTIAEGPVLFINTLSRSGLVEELKQRFTDSKVLNVKQQITFADALPVYLQLYEALKQTVSKDQTVILLTADPLLYNGFCSLLKTLLEESVIARARFMLVSKDDDRIHSYIKDELIWNDQGFAEVRFDSQSGQRQIKTLSTVTPQGMDTVLYRPDGVYWITGGMGAMGRLLAEHLANKLPNTKLILSGRRAENDAGIVQPLQALRIKGYKVSYLQGDIADRTSTAEMLGRIVTEHGQLNGVIHAAGLLRDGAFKEKTTQDLRAVLSPKIAGVLNLDEATKTMPLDFFVCCSSISSVHGNRGQSDYALANGFMDAFAAYRNDLGSERSGTTIAINWPLWRDGGMQVTPSIEAYLKRKWGLSPMPSGVGFACLEQCLASSWSQVMPLYSAALPQEKVNEQPVLTTDKSTSVSDTIKVLIGKLLKLDPQVLEEETELTAYGFDSISMNNFAQELGEMYGLELTAALFYDYDTIAKVAEYLAPHALKPTPVEHSKQKIAAPQQVSSNIDTQEPIAIIGFDGRFPGADDPNDFWNLILQQEMAISDLPKDGFRFKDAPLADIEHFGGGFLKHIDRFDAAFFAIDHEEARLMDPQQRLLLQSVWKSVEHAGYRMEQLSDQQTGLFIGVGSPDYLQLMCSGHSAFNSHSQVGVSPSMLANRISYHLNLKGPSEISDTACSSSIVAIHRAIRSLREGECELAIVGGVSLLLSARGYQGLKHLGFLSPSRASRSFDARADGYVRGEGLGSVLLKPLSQAERDHDHIHAVIKGSAVYHGGRSTLSLVAPSKNGQVGAMVRAYHSADLNPSQVQYIEAHGTATSFGDPAEISALKQAFTQLQPEPLNGKRIGIGALKPNIGHLEAASGIASLIKLTMALKTKKKPPLAGFESLNPGITLEKSPYYIVREAEDWQATDAPRRAGLNSYGFGGVNSHLVLEEYVPKVRKADDSYEIVTLSANDAAALEQQVHDLLAHLQQASEPLPLRDVSYTLCTGRTALPVRLAVIERDLIGLIERLQHFREHPNCLYREIEFGERCTQNGSGQKFEQATQLAQRFINGEAVNWDDWFAGETPHKVALPTQRFNGKSFWYDQ